MPKFSSEPSRVPGGSAGARERIKKAKESEARGGYGPLASPASSENSTPFGGAMTEKRMKRESSVRGVSQDSLAIRVRKLYQESKEGQE